MKSKTISLLAVILILLNIMPGCGGAAPTETPTPTPIPTPTPNPTATISPSTEVILDEIMNQIARIRELSPKAEIDPEFLSEQELKTYLDKDFTENNPVEELRIDKAELVMLDLLPADYDLPTQLLELSKEQVIGLYDDETNEMFVLGDIQQISPAEKVVLAHEYVHALEDQNFDMQSLPLDDTNNADRSMAALSAVEGDATLAMTLYAYRYLSPAEITELTQSEGGNSTLLESAPAVMRETLLFPYTQGMSFVLSIFLQGGWGAVDRLYSNLPKSTEQIIHPDKYVTGEQPQEVTIPDLETSLGNGWSQLDSSVLGELYMRIYLEAFIDSVTATKASEGWGGDRYVFLEDVDQRDLLVIRSIWDTEEDAQEFFDAYLVFMQNKGADSSSLRLEAEGVRWWNISGQSVYLSKEGSDVLLIIAPDEITVETILPVLGA